MPVVTYFYNFIFFSVLYVTAAYILIYVSTEMVNTCTRHNSIKVKDLSIINCALSIENVQSRT